MACSRHRFERFSSLCPLSPFSVFQSRVLDVLGDLLHGKWELVGFTAIRQWGAGLISRHGRFMSGQAKGDLLFRETRVVKDWSGSESRPFVFG